MDIRSFLACELPEAMTGTLARVSGELRKTPLNVKWVKEGNVHLTLVFLGNIDRADIAPIKQGIGAVCGDFGPFVFSLKGIGCFPNLRRPRVLWVGLRGEVERLDGFRKALQVPLKAFGVEPENRPFKPHLTLGRFRKPSGSDPLLKDLMAAYESVESPECRLDRLTFFKSTLRPGGAVYSTLGSWTLTGTL